MPNCWHEAYSKLTDFIAVHTDVKIIANMVSIPNDIRPEFYRLFNNIRTAFIEDKFLASASVLKLLSEYYLKAEHEVIQLLGLSNVSMDVSSNKLLHSPIEEYRKGVFDPLFDLLKARIDLKTFEEKAYQNVATSFWPLYSSGYEKWITLSLIRLLDADKSYQVTTGRASYYDAHKAGGILQETYPSASGSNSIVFRSEPDAVLIVPDVLIHSTLLGRYVAIRSHLGKAFATVKEVTSKRTWTVLNPVTEFAHNMTLIYVADNPDDISLVADASRLCQPDLVIKYGNNEAELDKVALEPRLGTYRLSELQDSGLVPDNPAHLLGIDFNQSKLLLIVAALSTSVPSVM